MTAMFKPHASFENGILRLVFRDSAVVSLLDIDVAVDIDEFQDPCGVEIIGVREMLGNNALHHLSKVLAGSAIRIGYDDAVDAAAIGVDIAAGSRILDSIPALGKAGLDRQGRWVTLEVKLGLTRD